MKPFPLLLFFAFTLTRCLAQDTTLVLNTGIFNSDQEINLSSSSGWMYHPGHNPAWARPDLNTAGWTKRTPGSFSAQDADGKAEGWFRLRLQLDSTFNLLPLGFSSDGWAASEVYVNGKLAVVFGSTGTGDKPYAEYNPFYKPGLPVPLETGKDYLIAIHIVDYVFPLPPFAPKKLKSEISNGVKGIIRLTRPQLRSARFIKMSKLESGFFSLWLTVSLLLAMLFWLLSSQKLPERNTIRLWAIVETLFVLTNLCRFTELIDTSFTIVYLIDFQLKDFILWQTLSLSLIALLRIFNYPVKNKWIGIGVLISLIGAIVGVYSVLSGDLFYIGCACQQLVFIYVLIISWKRLKGAQWAIVVGIGLSVLFASLIAKDTFLPNALFAASLSTHYLFYSGGLLSLPLSFLVYLVLRFKEILIEVQANADAVVQITAEKQDLLADQNERLEQQVEARTTELKASQQQLIQREKMASLGELTAGIAHEIQNPLNFVNNFSEVSTELVSELKVELDQGNTEEAKAIADDLTQNLQKITFHGGRASSIVKGMLEHSRTSTGERQPTDLNALADEYLRLAYQGLLAKDKTGSTGRFTCELVTDFDPNLGLIEVVPQEIGRVLLNLYNNAFYAVSDRQKTAPVDYKPAVRVSTRFIPHSPERATSIARPTGLGNMGSTDNGTIEIRVKDNGAGIPDGVKAKIFQPFFTTKPTGKGTGLGLSLSYDIVTKGHGGTLDVESVEGEETEFIVRLPV